MTDQQPALSSSPLDKRPQAWRLLELVAQWTGQVNTSNLCTAFGISRQSASALLSEYQQQHPDNLDYCPRVRGYQPSDGFRVFYSQGSLDEYSRLPGVSQITDVSVSQNSTSALYHLSSVHHQPQPHSVRAILQAIKGQQRLDIHYASITSPEFEERIISPHSLVHDGQRWHARAWCEKNQQFRDFVLSRVRNIFGVEGAAQQSQKEDELWHRQVSFAIQPDSRLSSAQQAIVAMDYDMQPHSAVDGHATAGWQREYRVRAALLMYLLAQLRLDRYRENPQAQQIVLTPDSHQSLTEQGLLLR